MSLPDVEREIQSSAAFCKEIQFTVCKDGLVIRILKVKDGFLKYFGPLTSKHNEQLRQA